MTFLVKLVWRPTKVYKDQSLAGQCLRRALKFLARLPVDRIIITSSASGDAFGFIPTLKLVFELVI